MLFLLVVFFLFGVGLTVLLWIGTMFFQNYFYTEATEGLVWQAPAAGFTLAAFFTFWCWLVQNTATGQELPYDTLFRFSPQVEKFKQPAKRLWAVKKDVKEPVAYQRKRIDQTRFEYREVALPQRPYSPSDVQAILIEEDDGTKTRLEPKPAGAGSPYREFADKSGWAMMEYESGPTGQLIAYRFGRTLANLFINFLHFVFWFACFWLLLRFAMSHALGFAVVMWLMFTLTLLPMVLSQAALATAPAAVQPPSSIRQ